LEILEIRLDPSGRDLDFLQFSRPNRAFSMGYADLRLFIRRGLRRVRRAILIDPDVFGLNHKPAA
jgi:hypothetical protein